MRFDRARPVSFRILHPANPAIADGRHVMVAPRDLVAAASPDPAEIGKRFVGKTAAGMWVKGRRDGLERELYLYQVADNQECLETFGTQAVVCQTAFTAVITLELLATGKLAGHRGNPETGVRSPEEFCADPYVALMAVYGFPGGIMEMDSEYKKSGERAGLEAPALASAGEGVALPCENERIVE